MSKDDGKAKQGAKRRVKVPKEIAGVKLPKELRRSAEALIEQARKPETIALLASGVAAVAGAAAAAKAAKRGAPTPPGESPAPAAPGAPGTRTDSADQITDALTAAARAVMQGVMKRG
jgi:hypothetical protein